MAKSLPRVPSCPQTPTGVVLLDGSRSWTTILLVPVVGLRATIKVLLIHKVILIAVFTYEVLCHLGDIDT